MNSDLRRSASSRAQPRSRRARSTLLLSVTSRVGHQGGAVGQRHTGPFEDTAVTAFEAVEGRRALGGVGDNAAPEQVPVVAVVV